MSSRLAATKATDDPAPTLSLRNVARSVRDIQANVPLYEAVGFSKVCDAGDLDGNAINLVGKPLETAPAPGTVRLVLRDGKAIAEPVKA